MEGAPVGHTFGSWSYYISGLPAIYHTDRWIIPLPAVGTQFVFRLHWGLTMVISELNRRPYSGSSFQTGEDMTLRARVKALHTAIKRGDDKKAYENMRGAIHVVNGCTRRGLGFGLTCEGNPTIFGLDNPMKNMVVLQIPNKNKRNEESIGENCSTLRPNKQW